MPKAAVLTAYETPLEVMDLTIADPGPGEVKVQVVASGVCHSDVSVQNLTMPLPVPLVLGHEGAGIITAVGAGVTSVAEGDHVVISWVPQCGTCFYCTRDQGYLCESGMVGMMTAGLTDGTKRFAMADGTEVGQMACTGTFSSETIIPATGAVKVPEGMDLKHGALIGCGVQTGVGAALNTASIRKGDTVAVLGCGGVGLNVIQGAKIAGAERIIAIDMMATKLEMATKFGATDTINAGDGDAVAAVQALTEGRGADVGFEVIGLQQTIEQALGLTRRGGETVIVGVPKMDVTVPLNINFGLLMTAKTIKGCWYGSSNVQKFVPQLLELHRDGKLNLDDLISKTITVDEVNQAFDDMAAGSVARSVIEHTH